MFLFSAEKDEVMALGSSARRPGRRRITGIAIAGIAALGAVGLVVSCAGQSGPPGASAHSAIARATRIRAAALGAERRGARTRGRGSQGGAASPGGSHAGPGTTGEPGMAPLAPGVTELATLRASVPGYASPGGRAGGTVPDTYYARRSVLPVIATRPGWLRVRLPRRPNGSTTWIRDRDVAVSATPFRIVVDLTTTRLKLYDQGRLVLTAPAGVGTPGDPTPAGEFFVAFDEPPPQPNPGYGPFIIVTSAHSAVISNWDGSGDAVIGIHGPLGDDSEIGTSGARISHGCVRLHVQTLDKLEPVPPGTPIDIVG